MAQKRIRPVENNKHKGKTYAILLQKYNDAMNNGFYGEAELIVYAFLEDRLRAFLYYCDTINTKNSNNINEIAERIYGREANIKNISTKTDVILKILKSCNNPEFSDDDYMCHLRKVFKYSINITEMKKQISKINKWCEYRNEVVHALFNKDLEDLRSGYKNHVEEGYLLARYIDQVVLKIKNV